MVLIKLIALSIYGQYSKLIYYCFEFFLFKNCVLGLNFNFLLKLFYCCYIRTVSLRNFPYPVLIAKSFLYVYSKTSIGDHHVRPITRTAAEGSVKFSKKDLIFLFLFLSETFYGGPRTSILSCHSKK